MQPPQPMPPPRITPVMRQGGSNPIPARRRKEEKENNKKQNREKKHTIRNVMLLISVLGIAYFSAPGITGDVPVPTIPPKEPGIEIKVPMPSNEEIPLSLPTEVTTPVETPETKPVVDIPAFTTQETKPKYDKHSLMYCLEFMDDEMVSVVAGSLRNSIDDFSSLNMGMYGNGCNMTFSSDREYVAHVFGILDSRAASIRRGGNYDKFAIAPQMEQLSGDVSKYLIAKAIGESGKYDKDQYEITDIDYYYTTLYGQTNAFDARTVDEENGIKVEDQLIGRSVHFKGHLKNSINSHCALDAAINGGHIDKGTGKRTQCAFGTQEGNVIDAMSIQAYDSLIHLFSDEYELVVTKKGKGVVLVYNKEYDR